MRPESAQAARRSSKLFGAALFAAPLAVGALVVGPLATLAILALSSTGFSGWANAPSALVSMAWDTVLLLAGVTVLATILGVGTAWLVACFDFPGVRAFRLLLLLPLAFPTYLFAYVAVEGLEFFGPAQRALRGIFGFSLRRDYLFPEVRSLGGAVVVFALVLFPYVHVPCRLLFERQGRSMLEAARMLGAGGWGRFWRIGLPMARPAIAGGLVFVLIETLNDIGAAEYLGVRTPSLLVRDQWLNRGDLGGASGLALAVLLTIFGTIGLERATRRADAARSLAKSPALAGAVRLRGVAGAAATLACLVPVMLGFVLPAGFLAGEAFARLAHAERIADYARATVNSIIVAGASAAIVVVLAAGVVLAGRLRAGRTARLALRLAPLGYAVPGTVLVLALLPLFGAWDGAIRAFGVGAILPVSLSGSLAAIVIALTVRFLGIGVNQGEIGLVRLSPNIDAVARILGARDARLAGAIHLPHLSPALMMAATLVFIDAMKELPATLLLRPLNFETLATQLYGKASAGLFEEGAFEALTILALGAAAVWIGHRRMA